MHLAGNLVTLNLYSTSLVSCNSLYNQLLAVILGKHRATTEDYFKLQHQELISQQD